MSYFERLLIGRHIADRYRIDAVIGRGGMGAVFAATDLRLERSVALKIVSAPPQLSDDEIQALRKRFHREARIAASISHPHVVRIYDFGEDPALGQDYLVMERLDGVNLAAVLHDEGPIPISQTSEILRQAAAGLAAGHEAGLVHRDVKPGNLLVRRRGSDIHTYLLDFGIAQPPEAAATVTRLTRFGSSPLSPSFASPEQLAGESVLHPASDVYSLGLTGLAMIQGGVPAGDPAEVLIPGRLTEAERSTAVVLQRVLTRALQQEPGHRYRHAGEMLLALQSANLTPPERVDGGEPAATSPAPPTAEPGADSRRPMLPPSSQRRSRDADTIPLSLRVFAVLVVVGGVGLGVWVFRNPDGSTAASDERFDEIVESEPLARTQPEFEYPEELWNRGIQGCTVLRLRVAASGHVDSASVESPSGYPAFDSSALAGVADLRFEPGRRHGVPFEKWVLLPVEFSLLERDGPCSGSGG
jgi:TonB family protein